MRFPLLAAALVLVGCGPEEAWVDEGPDALDIGESELSSYPGLSEGTPEAAGVLKLSNEASKDVLTKSTDVGVQARTANAIIAARTVKPFAKLADLYAVRYVGTDSVRRLLAYAKARGYVVQDDPLPFCAPGALQAGEVVFTGGTFGLYTRSCDGAGKCSPWKQTGYQQVVHADNGGRSLLVSGNSLYVSAQIGFGYTSQSGSSTYSCKNLDYGSGDLNRATGLGTGKMRERTRCDISGGSGGPGSEKEQRTVTIAAGANCVTIADPVVTASGTQYRRVIVLRK